MTAKYILKALEKAKYIEDDGVWFAEVDSMPGVLAYGNSREECLKQLIDVVEGWVALRSLNGLPVPQEFQPKKRKKRAI